ADSRGVKEAVGDVLPERAATGGLPDATGAAAEIEGAVVGWMASDGHDAPAAMRANATPLERPEELVVHSTVPSSVMVSAPGCFPGSLWILPPSTRCVKGGCEAVGTEGAWRVINEGGQSIHSAPEVAFSRASSSSSCCRALPTINSINLVALRQRADSFSS